jgi:hypothetical protein
MHLLRKHRGVAVLALLILVASTTAGGLYVMQPPPRPDPVLASRQALLHYLVVGELATDPEAYHVALVDRLMDGLAESPQLPSESGAQVPERYRSQLEQNLQVLKRAWFYSRGQRYQELTPAEQNAFLDRQIQAVLDWSRFDLSLQADSSSLEADTRRAAYASEFFGEIEQWISAAEAGQQPLLKVAVRDAIIRWLSTRNLLQEPLGTRQELAKTIVRELDRGMQLQQVIASLDGEQQTLLAENSLLLIEAWLHELAVEYEQLPGPEGDSYVDGRLRQITRWDLARIITSTGAGASPGSPAMGNMQASLKLFGIINGWINRADEDSRPRFEAFMRHLQQRWMVSQLGGR